MTLDEAWPAARYGTFDYELAVFRFTDGGGREWRGELDATCPRPECWQVKELPKNPYI